MHNHSYADLLNSLTPEVYESLKKVIEGRKWPDRRLLNDEELALCMQAVIAYEEKNIEDETIKTAYIHRENKVSTSYCSNKKADNQYSAELKWSKS